MRAFALSPACPPANSRRLAPALPSSPTQPVWASGSVRCPREGGRDRARDKDLPQVAGAGTGKQVFCLTRGFAVHRDVPRPQLGLGRCGLSLGGETLREPTLL